MYVSGGEKENGRYGITG